MPNLHPCTDFKKLSSHAFLTGIETRISFQITTKRMEILREESFISGNKL